MPTRKTPRPKAAEERSKATEEPRVTFAELARDPGAASRLAKKHGSVLVCEGEEPRWRVSSPKAPAPESPLK